MGAAWLNAGEHLFAELRAWERTASPTLKIPPRTLGGTPSRFLDARIGGVDAHAAVSVVVGIVCVVGDVDALGQGRL